jgi:hypothetical protein
MSQVINVRRCVFSRLRTICCWSFTFCPRRHGLKIFNHLVVFILVISYLHTHYYSKSLLSRTSYVCLCDTMSVDFPCWLAGFVVSHLFQCWFFHTFFFINIMPFRSYPISNLFDLPLFTCSHGPGLPNQSFFRQLRGLFVVRRFHCTSVRTC